MAVWLGNSTTSIGLQWQTEATQSLALANPSHLRSSVRRPAAPESRCTSLQECEQSGPMRSQQPAQGEYALRQRRLNWAISNFCWIDSPASSRARLELNRAIQVLPRFQFTGDLTAECGETICGTVRLVDWESGVFGQS
ncbi:hypothetical protein BDW62DRAFT_149191 [Aspergillus aurantiobrunneus]